MQVQVHTDNHIDGTDELTRLVEAEVDVALSRFGEQVTRVEVHLHDLNGPKGGIDKRCLIEAKLAGLQPVVAHHEAATLEDAITGAVEKLEHSLDHTLGKLGQHKGRTSYGGDQLF